MWRNQNKRNVNWFTFEPLLLPQNLVCQFFDILKTELPYDSAIPCLGIHPKELKASSQRYLYMHVLSSIIHNSQEMKVTQVSINK